MRGKETINRCNAEVMRIEAGRLGFLLSQIADMIDEGGYDDYDREILVELIKERDRLEPSGKFDHEEHFLHTGEYTKGILR